VPPNWPAQLQLHGPLPLTAEALPAEQRLTGAAIKVWPWSLPQVPSMGAGVVTLKVSLTPPMVKVASVVVA